jgi:hypothetical protein
MFAKLLRATWETILLLDVRDTNRLLAHPCPSAHAFVHRKSIALSAFLVSGPIVRDHAVLTVIVLGEFQVVTFRQVQNAGRKLTKQIRHISGPNHQVNGLKQQPIAGTFMPR